MALYVCKQCGYSNQIDDSYLGKIVSCPQCKKKNRAISGRTGPATLQSSHPRSENPSQETKALPNVARVFIGMGYFLLGAVALLNYLIYLITLNEQTSSPQEAAVAAMHLVFIVSGYVFIRSFEKFIKMCVG